MTKKKRIPKSYQRELDAIPVYDHEVDTIKALINKAIKAGLLTRAEDGTFIPTAEGKRLLPYLPKPRPWYDTNNERVTLLILAMNRFEFPV